MHTSPPSNDQGFFVPDVSLRGRAAIVIGSSRGIGRAIATELAQQGCDVVVNYHKNGEAAREVKAEIERSGGRAVVVQCDISDLAQHQKLIDAACDAFGRLDILVNNAAAVAVADVLEESAEGFDAILGNYEEADKLGRKIGALLAKAGSIRMTSTRGTDLRANIDGRPVQYETGIFRNPGNFAALPDSKLNISPVEGTSEGVIVGTVRLMGYGVIRGEPITIEVKNGMVGAIRGGKAAQYLEHTLNAFNDPSARNLAEFAVGLNPMCRAYATNLEDLGKFGFGHHGIGSNYAIGGKVKAPCHIDVIYSEASLEIDGLAVLDNGELLI